MTDSSGGGETTYAEGTARAPSSSKDNAGVNPAHSTNGPAHVWMSVRAACGLRDEDLPPDVDPDEMVHATRGEIHLVSECTKECP